MQTLTWQICDNSSDNDLEKVSSPESQVLCVSEAN